jgi:hypothetical protein
MVIAVTLGLIALTSARAHAAIPRCVKGESARTCASGVLGVLLGPGKCQTSATPATPPGAETAAERLQSLIDYIPCPQTGRVSFNTRDNLGESMSVLDIVPSPTGGYLGVYHTQVAPPGRPALADFKISIARSTDLIHWTRVAVLDPTGASMPTLRAIPGQSGFLLAYEKRIRDGGDVIRLRYYPSLYWLLAGDYAAQRDLPRLFSPYNNGTPTIEWIHWHGGLRRSAIGLGFHYQSVPGGQRGPDREATGTVHEFRTWSARPDQSMDNALDREGLIGSHGDWRGFSFDGEDWRLYEAQTAYNDFGTWRVILDSPSSGRMYPLTLTMGARPVTSSFANPIARLEPAPSGGGQVLVVTMFLFSARAAGAGGELVYYQPV